MTGKLTAGNLKNWAHIWCIPTSISKSKRKAPSGETAVFSCRSEHTHLTDITKIGDEIEQNKLSGACMNNF